MNCGQVQSGPRGALGTNLAFPARPRPTGLLPSSFRLSYLTLANIGSSARCYRFLTGAGFSLVHLPFSSLSALALTSSQISNLKFQIPSAFCLHPLAFRTILPPAGKILSLSRNILPLSRNIPPYPRISPLSFSFATSSHTITSIATPRSAKKPHPDYQPLAHGKNTHRFCSILPSRTTAPGSLSRAQSRGFRANGTAPCSLTNRVRFRLGRLIVRWSARTRGRAPGSEGPQNQLGNT